MIKILQILTALICVGILCGACTEQTLPTTTQLPFPPTSLPEPSLTPLISGEACLQGDWQMTPVTAETVLKAVTSQPSLLVAGGSLLLKFTRDKYTYHSLDLVLRSMISLTQFLEASAIVQIDGNFTVDANSLKFIKTSSANELNNWRMVIGGDEMLFQGNSPVIDFSMPESGTFECEGNSLEIKLDLPGNESLVMDFNRSQ